MLKPLSGKVILMVEKQDETESGLIITGNTETDSVNATVYAVSDLYNKEGNIENNEVKKGDRVVISKFSGNKIEYKKQEYIVTDISSILAIIEEE